MRKSYKPLLLLVLLCLSSGSAWAQRAVSGRVTDSGDGTPLPGVSVALKGTTSGTTTNADGRYTLQAVPDNAVLVFSFIGFTAQEVTVGNRSTIDVGLVSDVKALQEVVVTAQGIVREKKALGYAVTSVAPALIEQRPETDLGRILQGKVPGVAVTSTGGVSGTGTNIVIRGYSSITGNNQPLFVVDGVPINSGTNNVSGSNTSGFNTGNQSTPSRFLDIDPNNIENVSILRGLAATALYGDQGRAGVILITTKGGGKKAKPAEINLVQSVFVNRIASLPEYQNNYGGGFQQNPGFFFSNWGPRFGSYFPPNLTNGVDSINHPFNALQDASLRNAFPQFIGRRYAFRAYDGPEAFFRTGVISNSSLNVNGATEKMGYNATVGYVDEQGFVPGNTLRKLNVSLGMNAQLTDKLSIRSAFNYVNTDQASPPLNGGDGNNSFNDFPSIFANVLYTPRSVDLMGLPFESPVDNRSVYFRSGNDIVNPRWAVKYYKTTNVTNRFFTSNIVNYAVNPDLMLTYRVGLDTYSERQTVELNRGGTQAAVVNGYFRNVNITNTIWNHDFIISYNKRLSELFNIAAKLGGNMRNDRFVQDGMASLNQITFGLMRHSNFVDNAARDPFTNNILNLTQEETRMGVYGDLSVDFKNYLFLNVAARQDWTSTVEIANRRILYPSASISFVPTEAIPALSGKAIEYMKLRAGFGTSAGFPPPYRTRTNLIQSARAFVNGAGTVFPTHTVGNRLGNRDLRPELLTEYELGAEMKFLKNRIGMDLTWYRRETRDLITNADLDPSTGYTETQINIGRLRNTGIELAVNGVIIQKEGFNWDATLNYSRNVPLVVELGNNIQQIAVAGFINRGNFAVPGQPFNVIKGSGIRRTPDGQKIVGGNGQYLSTAEPVVLGNPNPLFTSALINNISYKGFTLSFLIEYRHGGAIYSSTAGAMLGRGLSRDTDFDRSNTFILPGVKNIGTDAAPNYVPNDIQITASGVGFNEYFFTDEARIFDGTTIRLREASLGYNLPAAMVKKTPFRTIGLSLTGSNLWFRAVNFPRYVNFDTDMSGLGVGNGLGFDYLTGPSARRYGVTLRLGF